MSLASFCACVSKLAHFDKFTHGTALPPFTLSELQGVMLPKQGSRLIEYVAISP